MTKTNIDREKYKAFTDAIITAELEYLDARLEAEVARVAADDADEKAREANYMYRASLRGVQMKSEAVDVYRAAFREAVAAAEVSS